MSDLVRPNVSHPDSEWEASLLTSILNIVHAPYGDFTAIADLATASSDPETLDLLVTKLAHHPQGKTAFEQRPRLGTIDLHQLKNLPDGTLGQRYAAHMLQNQLKPLEVSPADSDATFFGTHITETHDLWHVVTGCDTTMLGELQLQAFCVAQLEVSRFWLALLTKNLLKSAVYDIQSATQYMDAIAKGWLMGRTAKPLFGTPWPTLWETPLDQVRAALNVVVP
jgi:ubiquinone biosynthesis protein COQ4